MELLRTKDQFRFVSIPDSEHFLLAARKLYPTGYHPPSKKTRAVPRLFQDRVGDFECPGKESEPGASSGRFCREPGM
jgi:hypothetical protein